MKNKQYWKFVILIIIFVGGIGMFSLNRITKGSEEEQRNREYEASLVKALKDSYSGINQISITNPRYSEKPGSWSCRVELKFVDGEEMEYTLNHSLNYSTNRSAISNPKIVNELTERYGTTTSVIEVIYSNGDSEVLR